MKHDENPTRQAMLAEVERDITPGLPRVERAIAFVRTRGTATSAELHAVMELEPDELVSVHLADALADGRLTKDGKRWMCDPCPTVPADAPEYRIPTFAPPQPADNVVSLESQRTVRVQPEPKLDFAAFADMVNSQPAASASPAPVIRCALWSDGTVEVERDNKTAAVLFVEEVAHLADFWSRIANKAKETM